MYLLGVRINQQPNAYVYSDVLEIENSDIFGDLLKLDKGTIAVNGERIGSQAIVMAGDTIQVSVNSPITKGHSVTCTLTKGNQVVGYFISVTENALEYTYDDSYNTLFACEAIPARNWTPSASSNINAYNTDGSFVGRYNLNTLDVGKGSRAINVLDFNRNKVHVFDTAKKATINIIYGGGPISELTFYDTDDIKTGVAIAFNKDGAIRFYSPSYNQVDQLLLPNVAHIAFVGNKLYASAKNSNVLYSWTFNPISMAYSNPQTQVFADSITYLQATASELLVMAGTNVYSATAEVKLTLDAPARCAAYSKDLETVYVTHGQFDYITKIASDYSVTTLTMPGAIFLDTIAVNAVGDIYVNDTETKFLYKREAVTDINIELNFPGFGLVLSDYIYVLDAYTDLPSKISTDALAYTLDTTQYIDIEGVYIGDTVETGQIQVLTTNRPINVSAAPYAGYVRLLKNNIPVPGNVTTVEAGDTLALQVDYGYTLENPSSYAIIIDQEVFELNIFADIEVIIPNDFIFIARKGVPVSTSIPSNVITIAGLDRPIEVTATSGILVVNGIEVTDPVTVDNGDTLQIKVLSGDTGCKTVLGYVHIENRFTVPFSVSTYTAYPDGEDIPTPPALVFAPSYNLPLDEYVYSDVIVPQNTFPNITLNIPDIYDATLIRNGVDVGRTAVLRQEDSLRIKLKTTSNFEAPHHVTIHSCSHVFSWVAWTIGDTVPDEFDFGTILDVSIKDYVTSDVVTLSGVGRSVLLPVRFPYGTYPIINGVRAAIDPSLLDYRGVLRQDYTMKLLLSPGSTLQLEGYPRPVYGDTVAISVFIGGRRGYWTVGTWNTLLADTEASYLVGVDQPLEAPALQAVALDSSTVLDYKPKYITTTANGPKPVERNVTYIPAAADKIADRPNVYIRINADYLYVPNAEIVASSSNDPSYVDRIHTYTHNNSNTLLFTMDYTCAVLGTNGVYAENFAYSDLKISAGSFYTLDRAVSYIKWATNYTKVESTADTVHWVPNAYVGEVRKIERLDAIVFGSYRLNTTDVEYKHDTAVYHYTQMIYQKFSVAFTTSDQIKFTTAFSYNQQTDPVKYSPTYTYFKQNEPVEYTPKYVYPGQPGFTLYDPDYVVISQSTQAKYVPKYVAFDGLNLVSYKHQYVTVNQGQITTASLTKAVIYNSNLTTSLTPATEYHVGASLYTVPKFNATHRTQGSYKTTDMVVLSISVDECSVAIGEPIVTVDDYGMHDKPYEGELHPGYFATHALAVANAYSWDMINGDFYTINIPGRGWAWTMIIDCENMCNPNDCPPAGYIHGG